MVTIHTSTADVRTCSADVFADARCVVLLGASFPTIVSSGPLCAALLTLCVAWRVQKRINALCRELGILFLCGDSCGFSGHYALDLLDSYPYLATYVRTLCPLPIIPWCLV